MRTRGLLAVGIVLAAGELLAQGGRAQWTLEEARAWQQRVGVIKGFNQPMPPYPGFTDRETFKKAAELGFNSCRFWGRGGTNADEAIAYIRQLEADAAPFGITLSPVLLAYSTLCKGKPTPESEAKCKAYVQKVVGAFADDPHIIMWDIWNEPMLKDCPQFDEEMEWITKMVQWCREVSPRQAITASLIWDYYEKEGNERTIKRRCEVESLMDVHNFHFYYMLDQQGRRAARYIATLKALSDRPLVCTECIARTKGSSFARTMTLFAKEHVNFYSWGLYLCDANWVVSWGHSSYEPYEPIFHELLYPDGTPYDWRDLDWLRGFHFAAPGEQTDPGIELTDRWTTTRAWKWMTTQGPIKGRSLSKEDAAAGNLMKGFNAVRVPLSYAEWKTDAKGFAKNLDALLSSCGKSNLLVLPSLVTDADLAAGDAELAEYVGQVVRSHFNDARIEGWELYHLPGAQETNTVRLTGLLHALFRSARYTNANQPLLATPSVSVKPFAADFKFKEALIHGRRSGWDRLAFGGGSTPELVNLAWSLSDVAAYASSQKTAELGWLNSIAYRYGRPVFCTEWAPPDDASVDPSLERFEKSRVYWFAAKDLGAAPRLTSFRFRPILSAE